MVLVAVSALIVRSVQRAGALDLGFNPSGVAVASVNLAHGDFEGEGGRRWIQGLTARLEGLPGVQGVAVSSWVPMSGSRWTQYIRPEGFELGPDESIYAVYNTVSPGYFDLVGMPILAGREFIRSDDQGAPPVIVVNEAFVRLFWPGQDPLGKRVALGDEGPGPEVVGVIRDAMYGRAEIVTGEASPHFWTPRAQHHQDVTPRYS